MRDFRVKMFDCAFSVPGNMMLIERSSLILLVAFPAAQGEQKQNPHASSSSSCRVSGTGCRNNNINNIDEGRDRERERERVRMKELKRGERERHGLGRKEAAVDECGTPAYK